MSWFLSVLPQGGILARREYWGGRNLGRAESGQSGCRGAASTAASLHPLWPDSARMPCLAGRACLLKSAALLRFPGSSGGVAESTIEERLHRAGRRHTFGGDGVKERTWRWMEPTKETHGTIREASSKNRNISRLSAILKVGQPQPTRQSPPGGSREASPRSQNGDRKACSQVAGREILSEGSKAVTGKSCEEK